MGFEKELKDLYTFQKAADAKQAAAAPATGPSHARDRQIRQGGYGRALRRLSASTVVAAMTLANTVHLEVSPDGGLLVLFLVLFGGVALLVQHAYCSVAVIPDRTSK